MRSFSRSESPCQASYNSNFLQIRRKQGNIQWIDASLLRNVKSRQFERGLKEHMSMKVKKEKPDFESISDARRRKSQ